MEIHRSRVIYLEESSVEMQAKHSHIKGEVYRSPECRGNGNLAIFIHRYWGSSWVRGSDALRYNYDSIGWVFDERSEDAPSYMGLWSLALRLSRELRISLKTMTCCGEFASF